MNEIYSIQHGVDMVKFTTISNRKLTGTALASPQTSFGVRSSRIHFSPTVRGDRLNVIGW